MTIKSFEIDMGDGKKETIEYEDDLSFGDFEYLLSQTTDFTDVTKVRINVPRYKELILLTVLRKAPFSVKDLDALRKTKISIIRQIIRGVMKDYPLAKFLEESAQIISGEDQLISNNSILSLQENLDGTSQ
jgi:hypothetical protein